MPSLLIALCASHLAWLAASQPTLSFPFNAQLPPVARIDQFFSYSLSPHTFRSASNISYSLGEHPEWLSIDRRNGRLYGTPDDDKVPPGEVVGQALSLIATDDTGSASTEATLVVSRKEGPSVQIPLSRQITSFGRFSAPSTLLLYPSTEFEYIFDPETFSTPHSLNYYATSNDSSPLPSWLHFDRDRLRFSGKTPTFKSLVQPPQVFDISLVASDIVGFAGAWVSFSILVGSHQLTTDNPIVTLNVAKGSALRYERLDEGIKLDNKTLPPGDVSVSVENMPSWLSYDVDKGRLEGTPKDNDHSTNFTINFRDSLQDTLSVLVMVNVQTGLFQTTFEDVHARPGDLFSLDLQPYFRDPQDIDLSTESTPGGEWLGADGFILGGRVPKDAKGACDVTIEATSRSTGLQERETLHIDFLAADGTAVSSSSPSTIPSSQASGVIGPAMRGLAKQHSRQRTIAKILLATLIPLLFFSILGLLFVCLKKRRRQLGDFISEKGRAIKYSPTLIRLRARNTNTASIPLWWIRKISSVKQLKGSWVKRRHDNESELDSETLTSIASSETLRSMSTLEAPPAIMGSGRLGASRHSRTPNSNMSRESWFTVEGTLTPNRSETSVQTYRVPASLPGPAHGQDLAPTSHLRNTTDGASFQTTNLSTVSLEELSRIQPLAAVACNRHNSVDRQTTTTSSSAALPASFWRNHRLLAHIPGKWPLFPAPLRLNRQASPISEETAAAPRSSQQPASSCPMLFRTSQEPSDNRHSVVTSSSFASTENWRIMAWQETSRRLAGQATPHRPPRPVSPPSATEARESLAPPGVPGGGLELMSPSKWGDLEGGAAGKEARGTEGAKTDGDTGNRLTTPPVAGFEVDFDQEIMSDGREGAMRTIRTVLGEGGGKDKKSGNFI